MDVKLGLTSAELEKVLAEAGIEEGKNIDADVIRKAVAKAISANNETIMKQLMETIGQFNIGALMQQFMNQ